MLYLFEFTLNLVYFNNNMSTLVVDMKKIVALSLTATMLLMSFYVYFEPGIVMAVSDSEVVVVTLQVDTGISLTSSGNTSMSTNLGVSTHVANGTSTMTTATNDPLGYSLTVSASTNPAMKTVGGDSVPDFASTTPGLWYTPTGSTSFGFSVFGTDSTTATWGTGSFCNGSGTSTISTTLKYRGFSTSNVTIASRSSTTTPTGVTTTICYAVQQNGAYIPAGIYTATLTFTATAT
jgi:hypothetical protein